MSGKVLLVDDSLLARHTVARPLRALGIEVIEHDSVAAVTRAAPAAYTCALLDLELPDGDGVAIATHLHAHAPSLPVAFFTSVPSADLAERARAIGPVFEKPGGLDDAIRWIRELVERK